MFSCKEFLRDRYIPCTLCMYLYSLVLTLLEGSLLSGMYWYRPWGSPLGTYLGENFSTLSPGCNLVLKITRLFASVSYQVSVPSLNPMWFLRYCLWSTFDWASPFWILGDNVTLCRYIQYVSTTWYMCLAGRCSSLLTFSILCWVVLTPVFMLSFSLSVECSTLLYWNIPIAYRYGRMYVRSLVSWIPGIAPSTGGPGGVRLLDL